MLKLKKKHIKFFFKLIITVIILTWCISIIDIEALPEFIGRADVKLLLLAYLLNMMGNIGCPAFVTLLAIRSHAMAISLVSIIRINFIIRFYSLFLPAGVTAGVRWSKYKKYGSGADAAALILFEKLVQILILTVTVLTFVMIDYDELGPKVLPIIGGVSAMLFVALISIAPFIFFRVSSYFETLLNKKSDLFPTFIFNLLSRLLSAAVNFQTINKTTSIKIFLVAISGNILLVLGFYTLSLSFKMDLGLVAIAWIRAMTLLVLLLPITVANLGVREGSFIAFMGLYGVTGHQALGYGLTLTAFQLINSCVGACFEGWDNFAKPYKDSRNNSKLE